MNQKFLIILHFGYTIVRVETALVDANGNPVLKKGKIQAVKGKSDTEIIPLKEDVNEYFITNVLPYNKNAFLDRTKDKVGYDIPFTRLFYKFIEPEKSLDIFNKIKELEVEETTLMKELFGNE